jgi:elongation factor Ts
MSQIELIKELRSKTGAGVSACKKALQESNNNVEEAQEYLRKKGLQKAKSKSSRSTSEGLIGNYVHLNGKIGVMVEVKCETDFVARTDDFKELAHNLALHIAASSPTYVSREDIPENVIEKEKEIYQEQLKDEKKPANIMEKIIQGKLEKFYEENCLLEQPFVKDTNLTIQELLGTYVNKLGENIQIGKFIRLELGSE